MVLGSTYFCELVNIHHSKVAGMSYFALSSTLCGMLSGADHQSGMFQAHTEGLLTASVCRSTSESGLSPIQPSGISEGRTWGWRLGTRAAPLSRNYFVLVLGQRT